MRGLGGLDGLGLGHPVDHVVELVEGVAVQHLAPVGAALAEELRMLQARGDLGLARADDGAEVEVAGALAAVHVLGVRVHPPPVPGAACAGPLLHADEAALGVLLHGGPQPRLLGHPRPEGLAAELHSVRAHVGGALIPLLRDLDQQLVMGYRNRAVIPLVLDHSIVAKGHPVRGREVDGLGDVEPDVEARVEGVGVRDGELPLILHAAHHRDALLPELARAHHGDELVEEVRAGLEEVGQLLPHEVLEGLGVARGDSVPHLRGPHVQVVDAVQGVVLDVPAEGAHAGAHVEPRDHDPGDQLVAHDMAKQRVLVHRHVVHIPRVAGVLLLQARARLELRGGHLGLAGALGQRLGLPVLLLRHHRWRADDAAVRREGEPAPMVPALEVLPVEHLHVAVGILHDAPELPLHLLDEGLVDAVVVVLAALPPRRLHCARSSLGAALAAPLKVRALEPVRVGLERAEGMGARELEAEGVVVPLLLLIPLIGGRVRAPVGEPHQHGCQVGRLVRLSCRCCRCRCGGRRLALSTLRRAVVARGAPDVVRGAGPGGALDEFGGVLLLGDEAEGLGALPVRAMVQGKWRRPALGGDNDGHARLLHLLALGGQVSERVLELLGRRVIFRRLGDLILGMCTLRLPTELLAHQGGLLAALAAASPQVAALCATEKNILLTVGGHDDRLGRRGRGLGLLGLGKKRGLLRGQHDG
mmetsp:Transcript_5944/g.20250  ORF Transcript_5944/g.20250 Transcript_5944/m.20250 type:complete len:701 (+) Transcript_5944:1003-3105(+)